MWKWVERKNRDELMNNYGKYQEELKEIMLKCWGKVPKDIGKSWWKTEKDMRKKWGWCQEIMSELRLWEQNLENVRKNWEKKRKRVEEEIGKINVGWNCGDDLSRVERMKL